MQFSIQLLDQHTPRWVTCAMREELALQRLRAWQIITWRFLITSLQQACLKTTWCNKHSSLEQLPLMDCIQTPLLLLLLVPAGSLHMHHQICPMMKCCIMRLRQVCRAQLWCQGCHQHSSVVVIMSIIGSRKLPAITFQAPIMMWYPFLRQRLFGIWTLESQAVHQLYWFVHLLVFSPFRDSIAPIIYNMYCCLLYQVVVLQKKIGILIQNLCCAPILLLTLLTILFCFRITKDTHHLKASSSLMQLWMAYFTRSIGLLSFASFNGSHAMVPFVKSVFCLLMQGRRHVHQFGGQLYLVRHWTPGFPHCTDYHLS